MLSFSYLPSAPYEKICGDPSLSAFGADFDAAIQMLEAAGAVITTAETLILQLVPDTKSEYFGEVGEMLELEGEGEDAIDDDEQQ